MISSHALKAAAKDLGFELVGVTTADRPDHYAAYDAWVENGFHGDMAYLERHREIKANLQSLLPGARSVIAVGLFYNQPNPHVPGFPRVARYALGRDYHRVLHAKLRQLARWLHGRNAGTQTRACVDSAPLLERDLAWRAGLGWFGKNTMLINSRKGSWFVLGFLLTTADFEPDAPARGGCGSCRLCIDACPTGCIVERDGRWVVDARRCISTQTIEHRGPFNPEQEEAVGEWTFGCDVCQEVCPFNQPRETQPDRATVTQEPGFLDRRQWPSLVELAQITRDDWEGLTAGSAVRRAGFEGLRRNARANLRKVQN